MSTDSLTRDWYDLNYERKQRIHIVGLEVSRTMLNTHNMKLNKLSKDLRNELQKKDALIFGLSFLNCALETPMDMSVYAAMPPLIAQPLPSRSDVDKEGEFIVNSIERSRMNPIGDQVLKQSIGRLGDAVRLKQREYGDGPGYPNLFYRFHTPESHTFYSDELGFQCVRWLFKRIFEGTSAQEFSDHCNGEKSVHSPYISMTESPWRLLKFANNESSGDVFIIDARRLRATRIQVERTTNLAQQWDIRYTGRQDQARVQYVTETHWVAEGWIPHDCIAKRVPLDQFRKICMDKGIVAGYERARMEGLRLELQDLGKEVSRVSHRKLWVGLAEALVDDQNDLVRRTEGLSVHSI